VPRPSHRRIDQSPLAVTSSGGIVVGLGYTRDLNSTDEIIDLLRSGRLTGTLFVGTVLSGSTAKAALKRFDDAAAEIAATSGPERRSGRSHR
jgi:hypothetical protein